MAEIGKKPDVKLLVAAAALLVLIVGIGGYVLYEKRHTRHSVTISIGDKELSATFE